MPNEGEIRKRFRVTGTVQGVGFRPFVHSLAQRLGLSGFVLNDASGVSIEAEGDAASLRSFESSLFEEAPPIAVVEAVEAAEIPALGATGFMIKPSDRSGTSRAPISPDLATCDDCLAEMNDATNRRHRYAFINCTNCGPRFTITDAVPYDRPNTTMAPFQMCSLCHDEYMSVDDRRFHAQPIACPACGPRLSLRDSEGVVLKGDPVTVAADIVARGGVLAVKGLGGYHLVCDATDEAAVTELRRRKGREEKPLAVMVADIDMAQGIAELDRAEVETLQLGSRPIVLVSKRPESCLAESVSPRDRCVGVMLPYTPLHHLLLAALRRPLVVTSGNLSEEPIEYRDAQAAQRMGQMVDAILTHDRDIRMRCDDSVVRVADGKLYPVRRSRGFAPESLRLPEDFKVQVLGAGAQLKHTFCLGVANRAILSHHIGDLENYESMLAFEDALEHFGRVFEFDPEVVAHDLHPEYLSTKWALRQNFGRTVAVQHHHAHIASCLVDNGRSERVIGLALDGTGMGDDGTLWGCEVLVCDLASYERISHLREVRLPGGAAAVREPWRMAAVYLNAAFGQSALELDLDFVRRTSGQWHPILEMARRGLNSPIASSAGRLFDAAAALCGVGDHSSFEGQRASAFEQVADPRCTNSYGVTMDGGLIDGVALFAAVAEDIASSRPVAEVVAAFHNSLSETLVAVAAIARDETGIETVALSGGTWQNVLLLTRTRDALARAGFETLVHHRVPTNDGGISLGQTVVANAQISDRS